MNLMLAILGGGRLAQARYRKVERDGIVAVVANGRRLLLVRRIWLPFISFPGIWTFITGGREAGESHIGAAYREVEEETGIGREQLKLAYQKTGVMLFDPVRRDAMWENALFVFRSGTGAVRLNLENRAYRWAGMDEIAEGRDYTNIFLRERGVLAAIRRSLE